MSLRFCRLSLLILLFAGLNSCKKETKDCNTTHDCQVIGKYVVTASHYTSYSPDSISYSVYGQTTISVFEIRPGTIVIEDDSIFHVQFSATYDSLFPHNGLVFQGFSGVDTIIEIGFGGDTILAKYFGHPGFSDYNAGEQYYGVKVH